MVTDQLGDKKMYRNYCEGVCVCTVKVLSKRQRQKCNHRYRLREGQDISNGWNFVCARCGAVARGGVNDLRDFPA